MKYDIDFVIVEQKKYKILDKSLGGRKFKVPAKSKLVVDFSGKNMHTIIANTIRRVCLDNIPTYAFNPENIKITANNTIENNDMMRLRMSQLPVLDTDCELFYLHPKYWRTDLVDFQDQTRERHESEKTINIDINYHNNSNEIYNVTTNNIKYTEGGKDVPNKYNSDCPILLAQLRPAETFACSMRATLGTGERNNIYSAVNTCYYDDNSRDPMTGQPVENKNNRVTLTIESSGQSSEAVILLKSFMYIQKRLNDLTEELKSKKLGDQAHIVIDLENEDHTMGELINYAFQDHEDIQYSGCAKLDHLINNIRISVLGKGNKSPLPAIYDQLDALTVLFHSFETKMLKQADVKEIDPEKSKHSAKKPTKAKK